MEIRIIERNGVTIADVDEAEGEIISVYDALDLMADAHSQGAQRIALHETDLSPAFFDLSTRLAGEILQKFSTYGVQLAIIGDFEKYESKSLQAFIRECNRGAHIHFVPDREQAMNRLSS